jgi:hypothetical protein
MGEGGEEEGRKESDDNSATISPSVQYLLSLSLFSFSPCLFVCLSCVSWTVEFGFVDFLICSFKTKQYKMASFTPTPWGYLEPINSVYPRATLVKSSYTIGRHPGECDITLDSIELKQHEYFIHLSSKHFTLECLDNGRRVLFRDVSRNGCYIDGELVHHSTVTFKNSEHIM